MNLQESQYLLARIREMMNEQPENLTDERALQMIENYVFSHPRSSGRSCYENGALVQKLFLTLRRELGILQPLADDPAISEIMVNGTNRIFVERSGVLEQTEIAFDSAEELEELIRRIASRVHREINELNPIVDARLSDGSRVNAVLSGIALGGPALTIRKFPAGSPMQMQDLIDRGTITPEAAKLLQKLVRARYNCFVSGGTSSGKTTFLNVLSRSIPPDERIIVIEDSAELKLDHIRNVVRLECRSANVQGRGGVDMSHLVRSSLRMWPDRIIVGEVRGEEVMHVIQAMNTGHDGSMSTGHANSVSGMLKRLEAMFLQAADIPVDAIRRQLVEGIDIIIHMMRMRDGSRRVSEISELDTIKNGEITTNCLYRHGTGLTGNKLIHKSKLEVWS